jgi:hypothetical protein
MQGELPQNKSHFAAMGIVFCQKNSLLAKFATTGITLPPNRAKPGTNET